MLRSTATLALAFASSVLLHAADDSILGALRIANLDDLAAHAAGFADTVQPGAGASTAQLTAGAAMFGIDTSSEILVLVLDPQKTPVPVAFVVPVVDPAAVKANPAFGFAPATAEGHHQITLNGRPMFAAFAQKRLVVSPAEQSLELAVSAVATGDDIRHLRAAGGQLGLSLDTGRLYAAYKPVIDLMLANMRGQYAKASAASGANTPNPADFVATFLGSVGELDDLALTLSLAPDHLALRSQLTAKTGTTTAILLNPGRGPAVTSLGIHDSTSAILGTVSAHPGPEFWRAYSDLFGKLLAASGTPGTAETSALLEGMTGDFAAIWDGTASFGMLTGTSVSGTGVAGITDRAKLLDLLKTLPELHKKMGAANEAQGLAVDVTFGEVQDYHGASLLDFSQTYRALAPAMEEALTAMRKMGMEHLTATYAITADQAFYAMGDNSRARAEALVDAKSVPAAAVTPTSYGLPANATLFTAISLPRYMAWISNLAPLPFTASTPLPADLKPGLALTVDLDAGRADFRLHLAASEIAAVLGMIRSQDSAPAAPPAAD